MSTSFFEKKTFCHNGSAVFGKMPQVCRGCPYVNKHRGMDIEIFGASAFHVHLYNTVGEKEMVPLCLLIHLIWVCADHNQPEYLCSRSDSKQTFHVTYLLKLLDKMCKYEWIWWVLLKIQSGHDSVHRRTDGQCETSIPPFNFVEGGGGVYNNWDSYYITNPRYTDIFKTLWKYISLWQMQNYYKISLWYTNMALIIYGNTTCQFCFSKIW